MIAPSTDVLALSGSSIDGSWYVDVTDFARETPWLNSVMTAYTSFGIVAFAVLIACAWWTARRRSAAEMAAALAVPVATVGAYVLNEALKWLVAERRPCYAYPLAYHLVKCESITDYSFPSNHSVVVAACTCGLFLVGRRLGLIALALALIMGFSRVYVGAHYPHDVLVGLVVGAVLGTLIAKMTARAATSLVERLRETKLRPLLATTPQAEATAAKRDLAARL